MKSTYSDCVSTYVGGCLGCWDGTVQNEGGTVIAKCEETAYVLLAGIVNVNPTSALPEFLGDCASFFTSSFSVSHKRSGDRFWCQGGFQLLFAMLGVVGAASLGEYFPRVRLEVRQSKILL